MRNIRHTLPDIINVLILFFFSIATFSLISLKLFAERNIWEVNLSRNESYFDNFGDIFFNFYVLVTTANNPDVM